jgi:hypothetical protein
MRVGANETTKWNEAKRKEESEQVSTFQRKIVEMVLDTRNEKRESKIK